ncbi:hypothetical protein N2152v2_000963 [Parachlorella kessleri]
MAALALLQLSTAALVLLAVTASGRRLEGQGSVVADAADYQLAGNRTRLQLERGTGCPPGDAACFCRGKGALGMFADAASCQGYYWCVGPEQAFYKQCSQGLRFSDSIQNCDWAANVACGGAAEGPAAPNGGSSPASPAQPSPSAPADHYTDPATGCSCTCPASPQPQPQPIPSPPSSSPATTTPTPASPHPKPQPIPSPPPPSPATTAPTPAPTTPSPSPTSPSPATPAAPANPPSTPADLGTYLGTARATYHYYGPSSGAKPYDVSTLFCADAFAGKPASWLSQYPWTAYCMDTSALGPMKGTLCGQCLRVTNKRTGHAEVVRIVDMCGNGALDLDYDITFKSLDTDGQGYNDGHMMVDVETTAC